MTYEDWLTSIPPEISDDPVWKATVYRQALFLGEISWFDACKLALDKRTLEISDQLYRATGKISSNITEGFSRASGKDQARFYEYALGPSRETRDWYYKGRHILSEEVAIHRIRLTVHIIRQLLTLIPKQRGRKIQEEMAVYEVYSLESLLNHVPMPE